MVGRMNSVTGNTLKNCSGIPFLTVPILEPRSNNCSYVILSVFTSSSVGFSSDTLITPRSVDMSTVKVPRGTKSL